MNDVFCFKEKRRHILEHAYAVTNFSVSSIMVKSEVSCEGEFFAKSK